MRRLPNLSVPFDGRPARPIRDKHHSNGSSEETDEAVVERAQLGVLAGLCMGTLERRAALS